MGEPALAVLAVADSVCYGLVGAESFYLGASSALWDGAAAGGNRLGDFAAADYTVAEGRVAVEKGGGGRLEGKVVGNDVCIRDPRGVSRTAHLTDAVYNHGDNLVCAGQEDRACCHGREVGRRFCRRGNFRGLSPSFVAAINVAVETATQEASGCDAVRSRPTRMGDFRVKELNGLAASALFRRGER